MITKRKCNCVYCKGNPEYHRNEAIRIEVELNNLGVEFAGDGMVRTVLRRRLASEREKGYYR